MSAKLAERKNGTGSPPERSALERPRIVEEVEVPEHPGYVVTLWKNYPRSMRVDLFSEDAGRVETALRAIVLGHNGWPDEDGNVLPPPDDPEFWERIDQYTATVLGSLIVNAPTTLPNSLRRTRRI